MLQGSALSLKRLLLTIDTPKLYVPLLSPTGSHLAVYRRHGKKSSLSVPSPLSLLLQQLPDKLDSSATSDSLLTDHLFSDPSSSSSRADGFLRPYQELATASALPLQTAWTPCSRFYLTLMPDGHLTAFFLDPKTGELRPSSAAPSKDDEPSVFLQIKHSAYQTVSQAVVSFGLPASAPTNTTPTVLVQDHRGVLRLCTLSQSSPASRGTPIGQWPGRREQDADEGPWLWDGNAENPTVVGISSTNEASLNPMQLLVGRRDPKNGSRELVWETLFSWNVFDRTPIAFTLLQFAPCSPGQTRSTAIYAIDARGTLFDKNCLVRIDFSDRKNTKVDIIARHPDLDIASALFDPVTRLPVAVAVKQHRISWLPLDSPSLLQGGAQDSPRVPRSAKSAKRGEQAVAPAPEAHDLLKQLTESVPGNCDVVNIQQSASGRWLLQTNADCASSSTFLFDRQTQGPSTRLYDSDPLLKNQPQMPTTELLSIPFDEGGVKLDAYLTLPPRQTASSSEPHPLLVLPHGGPCERDNWEYNPIANFYAAAGLAVLRVNYLGSAGYGRRFETRVYGRLGTEMTDSLVAATRWCAENTAGRIDGDRIGIYGGSAGGYLAMSSLVRAPELFRCGAAWNGFFSLPAIAATGNDHIRNLVGDEKTAVDHSILSAASRIRAPILLMSGGNDPFVHFSHSVRLDRAIRGTGGKSRLIVFPSEGHDFSRASRLLYAHGMILGFLQKHLQLPRQPVSALGDLLFDRTYFYLEHSVDLLSRLWQR